jgi:hypothetical protein
VEFLEWSRRSFIADIGLLFALDCTAQSRLGVFESFFCRGGIHYPGSFKR